MKAVMNSLIISMGPESYPRDVKRKIFQKTQFTIIKVLECLCVILAESKNGNSYDQIFQNSKIEF